MKKIMYLFKKKFVRSSGNDIDYKTLLKLVRDNRNVWIIDVRARDEYYSKHIENSINIPLQDISSKIESVVRNKNDMIIVYCEYGGRSLKACNKLKKLGYTNVLNLQNGISGI